MIRNEALNKLIQRVARRAEMSDRETLARTYVPIHQVVGGLQLLDHQVVYGRRGTGKTHAFNHLAAEVEELGDLPIYIDLRTIGSSGGLYSDATQSIEVRGTRLLVDVLEEIHDRLLTKAVEDDNFVGMLEPLDSLGDAATEVRVEGQVSSTAEMEADQSTENSSGINVTADIAGAVRGALSAGSKKLKRQRQRQTIERSGSEVPHVLFGRLYRSLEALTASIQPRRIWLLLDEWSSLPPVLQPILADMLRRTFFPCKGLTVKIGAIERRSAFYQRRRGANYLGIELGSDTAASLNLYEHLLATEEESNALNFFADLLFRHVSVLMQDLGRDLTIRDKEHLVDEAFEGPAFREFVRAAEGVPRDGINILGIAAARASGRKIRIGDVQAAARAYYLRDKVSGISGNIRAERVWESLQRAAVVNRRSRTFLLKRRTTGADSIMLDLFDARLIHLLRQGIHAPGQPELTYDGYALDYGSYIHILQEQDIAEAWSSARRPWTFRGGEAFLSDNFDEDVIFTPPKTTPRKRG